MSSLKRSIILTGFSLYLIQTFIFSFFIFLIGKNDSNILSSLKNLAIYLSASAIFHILITALLLANTELFTTIHDNKRLSQVNLTNKITLFRLTSMPTILALFLVKKEYPSIQLSLIILIVPVFLSDFIDGKLSRQLNQVTKLGQSLDSSSDYFLLLCMTIIYYVEGFISQPYLFGLIMARGTIMVVFVTLLRIITGKVISESSFLGKASIFAIMVLYALELLDLFNLPEIDIFLIVAEITTAAIIAISLIDKIIWFGKTIKKFKQGKLTDV
jgi:phosphatidylglycerophosphate synthase